MLASALRRELAPLCPLLLYLFPPSSSFILIFQRSFSSGMSNVRESQKDEKMEGGSTITKNSMFGKIKNLKAGKRKSQPRSLRDRERVPSSFSSCVRHFLHAHHCSVTAKAN